MKPAFIIGMCRGFELGHNTFAGLLIVCGRPVLGLGVFLMGLGWWAARRQWERVAAVRAASTAPRESK